MIFPCPENLRRPSVLPMTWALLAVNFVLFFLIFIGSETAADVELFQSDNLRLAGQIYQQYLETLPAEELRKEPTWIARMTKGHRDQMEFLGAYALRHRPFLAYAQTAQVAGDQVAIEKFRHQIEKFRAELSEMPLHRFGISSERRQGLSWVTYQFSHASLMHLFSNMIFLVFLGMAIETQLGGLALLLVYLAGGVAGGVLFLLMNPQGVTPMVGASGSVSALLAFYALFESRWRIRYYYFVFPMTGQYGFIYLPVLLIWPLFLVADFVGLLSAPEGLMGGVAYAAHVGGAIFGAALALVSRLVFRLETLPPDETSRDVNP